MHPQQGQQQIGPVVVPREVDRREQVADHVAERVKVRCSADVLPHGPLERCQVVEKHLLRVTGHSALLDPLHVLTRSLSGLSCGVQLGGERRSLFAPVLGLDLTGLVVHADPRQLRLRGRRVALGLLARLPRGGSGSDTATAPASAASTSPVPMYAGTRG